MAEIIVVCVFNKYYANLLNVVFFVANFLNQYGNKFGQISVSNVEHDKFS